jgi:hypothetical protein
MKRTKAPKRSKTGAGRIYAGKQGTYIAPSRMGVNFPNEDIGQTITLEEYRREGQ